MWKARRLLVRTADIAVLGVALCVPGAASASPEEPEGSGAGFGSPSSAQVAAVRAATTPSALTASSRAQIVASATATAAVALHLRDLLDALRAPPVRGVTSVSRRAAHAAPVTDGASFEVRRLPGDRTPRQVRGRMLHPRVQTGLARRARDTATAREYLRASRGLLRLDDPDAELRVERTTEDPLGGCQVRFAQECGGLDVWPARLLVQTAETGDVDLVSGAYIPTPRGLVFPPTIDAAGAAALARSAVTGGTNAELTDPELIVHAGRRPRLAWKLEVTVSDSERRIVVVDAHTGAILRNFNEVPTEDVLASGVDRLGASQQFHAWHEGSSYYMVDTSKAMYDPTSDPPGPGTTRGGIVVLDAAHTGMGTAPQLYYVLSTNPASWPVADAVSASSALSQTYDYYLSHHGRNSIDGQGGTLFGIVRWGTGLRNAFWSDGSMKFGDADAYVASIDVVGHEMTHGVTEKTAGLVYQGQSGALNEAMSDIFGEMVESDATGAPNDWRIGTELTKPLRDMRDPSSMEYTPGLRYPSRMSQYADLGSVDNGGVHINSGIINRAYYLLAAGLPNAVGRTAAERIFYRALTTKLLPQSQFVDCRLGAVASAEELFGTGSAQARAVADAFDAVEIYVSSPTAPPSSAPAITGADGTVCIFFDPTASALRIARRETAFGDPAQGTRLTSHAVAESRPCVTGDGALLGFVDAAQDACFVRTDGTGTVQCAGLAGRIHTIALAPDASRSAVVLLDAAGTPLNSITVSDLTTGVDRTFPLVAPVLDGGTVEVVQAGAMTFTRDGGALIYDAFNVVTYPDGTRLGLWSIYALDFATETVVSVVSPTPGLDIGNPALSHTSDRYLTFEAVDAAADETTVYALDLFTGDLAGVVRVFNAVTVAAPAFTGDDRAIVVTGPAATNTATSLYVQALAADHVTPTGSPALWLDDGAYGAIYRRGEMPPVPPPASFDLTFKSGAPKIASIAVDAIVGGDVVPVRLDLAYAPNGRLTGGGTSTVGADAVAVSGRMTYRASAGVWRYSLNVRSGAPKVRLTVAGTVGGSTATVSYRGPLGRARAQTAPATVSGEAQPTTRVTLTPTVDVLGRVHGSARVLGGFGNDQNTVGTVTGSLRGATLKLNVKDVAAGRKLRFTGTRSGSAFLGKLTFRLPPVRGTLTGYAVPAVFGE